MYFGDLVSFDVSIIISVKKKTSSVGVMMINSSIRYYITMTKWQYTRKNKTHSFERSYAVCINLWSALTKLGAGEQFPPEDRAIIRSLKTVVSWDYRPKIRHFVLHNWWRGNQYRLPKRILKKFYKGEL